MNGAKVIRKFQSLQDVTWSSIADGQVLQRSGANIIGVTITGFDGAFASLSGKPTTIGGYGITDLNSLGDARWQPLSSNLTTYAGIAPSANVQTLLGAATFAAFKTSLSLGNVENTALSTWAGSANITTLGTIATGTVPTTLLSGTITNAQLAGSIAYSKLSLTGAILNADLAGSIALSKLATDPLARANHTGTQLLSTISDVTTVGGNLAKATNPSAISFPKVAADNTVSFRTPAEVLSDIGAQASGSYAASGVNADITSVSTLVSFGTGSVATIFNSSGVLRIGGSTSSSPGLKKNSAQLQSRLADDSDFADFGARDLIAGRTTDRGILYLGSDQTRYLDFNTTSLTFKGATILKLFDGTSGSPALKRSSATLQARLADDSAFTSLGVSTLLLNGATSGVATLAATDAVSPTITLPSTTGTLALAGANADITSVTLTGASSNSYSGTASTPALKISGVPFAGTGTTSFPLLYINDANATASTTLNTAGTYFGVNGDGTQDLMNLLKDGASLFKVGSTGAVTIGANTQFLSTGALSTDRAIKFPLTGPVWDFFGDSSHFYLAEAGVAERISIALTTGLVTINQSLTVSGTTDSTTTTSGSLKTAGGLGVAKAVNIGTTLAVTGIVSCGAQMRLKGYTVATLPAGTVGDTAYVTDSLLPSFGATIAGGGAVVQEVFYNGTNWIAS